MLSRWDFTLPSCSHSVSYTTEEFLISRFKRVLQYTVHTYDISSSDIIRICGSLYIHFTVYLDPCFIF